MLIMEKWVHCFEDLSYEIQVREEHHQFESVLVLEGGRRKHLDVEED